MARTHLIGLLLGTEEDWSGAFEALLARTAPSVRHGGETHEFTSERVTIEPFDLRATPRHTLVIDRLAHWYYVPREWLKKIALMDGVYLMNNPFTFQSMEKHSAYCAMMRLGLKVPDTWLVPYKQPLADERFAYTASRYNQPFDLPEIAAQIGYPLFMKPFDGGAWVGVSQVRNARELAERYDDSGQRLMHLQKAVDGFEVFARSLSIGPETMVMRFDPVRPQHDRYQVDHDFLDARTGDEVITIGRTVNAFFRWEFNSCETLIRDGEVFPIDYANACPDVSLISLHYYFPWAIKALLRWSVFCCATGRPMRVAWTRAVVRGRRAGHDVRGEARRLPRARGRGPRRRGVRRVLRPPPPPRRRGDGGVHRLARLRPPARRDGDVHVPARRARAVRRPLPRPARRVGARPGERVTASAGSGSGRASARSGRSGPARRPGSRRTLGYGAWWVGGSPQVAELRRILEATSGLVAATGILNVWRSDAGRTAADAAELRREFPGRLMLGIGIGHPEATSDYRRPLTSMRAFLDALDAAPEPPPVEARCLAALRPKMLDLGRAAHRGRAPLLRPGRAHADRPRAARAGQAPRARGHVRRGDRIPARGKAVARDFAHRYLGMRNYTQKPARPRLQRGRPRRRGLRPARSTR